jgi:hypothetical protein
VCGYWLALIHRTADARTAGRFAMWVFSRRKQLERKFLGALLHEPPIEPKHTASIVSDNCFSSIENKLFFSDFEAFADALNFCLSDTPWRIQELPDTRLALSDFDDPAFGRRYDLFHRQIDIGTLEIAPDLHYTRATPSVFVNLQMDWVRLLSFASINRFLYCVAAHVCETRGTAWSEAKSTIDRAMTEALWESQRITENNLGENYGTLELRLHGLARLYFRRKSAPRSQPSTSRDCDDTILSFARSDRPARH